MEYKNIIEESRKNIEQMKEDIKLDKGGIAKKLGSVKAKEILESAEILYNYLNEYQKEYNNFKVEYDNGKIRRKDFNVVQEKFLKKEEELSEGIRELAKFEGTTENLKNLKSLESLKSLVKGKKMDFEMIERNKEELERVEEDLKNMEEFFGKSKEEKDKEIEKLRAEKNSYESLLEMDLGGKNKVHFTDLSGEEISKIDGRRQKMTENIDRQKVNAEANLNRIKKMNEFINMSTKNKKNKMQELRNKKKMLENANKELCTDRDFVDSMKKARIKGASVKRKVKKLFTFSKKHKNKSEDLSK